MSFKSPEDPSNINILHTTTKKEMISNIPVYTRKYPKIPETPGNTRKYPTYPEIPESKKDTRKYLIVYFYTLTRPDPIRYPVFCPIPDPTRPDIEKPYPQGTDCGHLLYEHLSEVLISQNPTATIVGKGHLVKCGRIKKKFDNMIELI